MPEVDLLASRFNTKLNSFVCRYKDPLTEAVDAVALRVHYNLIYDLSPLKFLLHRIKMEGILVIPQIPHSW